MRGDSLANVYGKVLERFMTENLVDERESVTIIYPITDRDGQTRDLVLVLNGTDLDGDGELGLVNAVDLLTTSTEETPDAADGRAFTRYLGIGISLQDAYNKVTLHEAGHVLGMYWSAMDSDSHAYRFDSVMRAGIVNNGMTFTWEDIEQVF
jgi:hypothetical protein